MKKLTVGILAHVDAGKTTLSEGLLFRSGQIRRLGRVDHQDAFLDTHAIERERGITIFSKQAVFYQGDLEITLLDTPGHVDFSSEMERTLQVLDYAIVVISGSDGVQGHTRTLWRLLDRYRVPTFLFLNKMDLAGPGQEGLLKQLRALLDEGCIAFGQEEGQEWLEQVAMCDEQALNCYLETGELPQDTVAGLIARRRVFPCYFGSALKLEGVDALLEGLERYAQIPAYPEGFAARVYQIGRDAQGVRLTYLKVTGGCLRVKDLVAGGQKGLEGQAWEEKVDQIRIYSGAKYQAVDRAPAGTVCAVTGLGRTWPGQGLGLEGEGEPPALAPALSYQVILPQGCDPHVALAKLRQMEEEDPQLHISWSSQLREIHVQLMGEVQLEILQRLVLERFGLEVSFGQGGVVYRETIAAPVEGVGHFEPLRHYAEVHLLLEPGERGSGLTLAANCPPGMLDGHWQRLILSHLEEREHPGVLTGSPVTDLRITLVAGRAHPKHTEGGDFRQATYRALRQGLKYAQNILLEPWYDFRLELPAQYVGRAMTDLQRRHATVESQPAGEGEALLTGRAPVACLRDYAGEVISYTKGLGRLFCTLGGYAPCHNQEEVVSALSYDSDGDPEYPSGSVFCSHGAGHVVPWDQVRAHMHVDSGLRLNREEVEEELTAAPAPSTRYTGTLEQDKELQAIFERTYGPVKPRAFQPAPRPRRELPERQEIRQRDLGPEYLLVDGYNIIFAWEELKAVAQDNLDAARQMLMDVLSNYQGFRQCQVILVFDAYRVPGGKRSVVHYHNIHVVYTKEAETADAYIEKATLEIGRHHRVRVATSDGAEQLIILGHGALRLSARAFRAEVEQVGGQIAAVLAQNNNRPGEARPVRQAMEQAQARRDRDKKG